MVRTIPSRVTCPGRDGPCHFMQLDYTFTCAYCERTLVDVRKEMGEEMETLETPEQWICPEASDGGTHHMRMVAHQTMGCKFCDKTWKELMDEHNESGRV